MSRMFPFITVSDFNPLGGTCQHNCVYGWCKLLIKKFNMKKYQGQPFIDVKQLKRTFQKSDFVFVCDMCDLFGEWVPSWMIQCILDYIGNSPATFLLLTKNPKRYLEFKLPSNCVAGATIETEFPPELYGKYISNAPNQTVRLLAMAKLQHPRKMVSIEPILDFSPIAFLEYLKEVHPEFIAIGFDNYNNHLPEPESLEKVLDFITELEKVGIKVYRKTIREPILSVGGKSK